MTREQAMSILERIGWNTYGAEAIVGTAIDDGTFENMTEAELRKLSEDYADR